MLLSRRRDARIPGVSVQIGARVRRPGTGARTHGEGRRRGHRPPSATRTAKEHEGSGLRDAETGALVAAARIRGRDDGSCRRSVDQHSADSGVRAATRRALGLDRRETGWFYPTDERWS